ncbi:tyrosine-type recombinase/integrase [Amycolatopsis cynarae]|uniref:Tyrosine-type recombinase/integrase n=1 Tax=Amycolatopsis cynarae TaxID=2995223 RepID=A0ABY7AYU2_9PSEU|nr:tyrosine-type recombinase/integrase [Amycolatopsis sp. HUAS 11-8]WAL65194.1 tyrosine-type recombinase/integrase [Amycolatopsis sp. HUAS 11-8]
MDATHEVRIWAIKQYRGKKKTTYRVRWVVAGNEFGESFETSALADSFRSGLVSSARSGEAFDTESGLPVSMKRQQAEAVTWYAFACSYVDMKWPDSSPKYRKSLAESMTRITVAMLHDSTQVRDGKKLRNALMTAFNKRTRADQPTPATADLLKTVERNCRRVSDLTKPDVLRSVLGTLDLNLDGRRASANTVRIRRTALGNAIDYAIEKKLLAKNPLAEIKVKKRNYALNEVDPASVVNPTQARMLLAAVDAVGKQGPPLVAFFALMYYAGLRPEEAAALKKSNLSLPKEGWGDLNLEGARPEIGQEWTDSGEASAEGPLKHREAKVGRVVPCSLTLTAILHNHLARFGTAPDGRLFRGARNGGRLGSSTYGRVWAKAREAVFTAELAASALAKRPYDLRHASVSTWLSAGVEAPRVAKWAGHSLTVLLKVYAKCLDGGEKSARDRVERSQDGW